MDVSRRDLLKGGTILAAGLAATAGIGLAGCSTPAESEEKSSGAWDKEVDILVLGGGIGGTMAGYVASQGGAKTLLAEAGSSLGGTMLLSMGSIHTMGLETVDDLATLAPTSDPVLAKRFMEGWIEFRDSWLLDTGAPNLTRVEQPRWNMVGVGTDHATRQEFFDFFADEITAAESEVLYNTRGMDLITDENNSVIGAVLVAEDGSLIRVGAKAVILACGGFGANPEMKLKYFGQGGDQLTPWSVPYNRGDGHRMALNLGGQLTSGMGRWYGHIVGWPNPLPSDTAGYDKLAQEGAVTTMRSLYELAQTGIVVNLNGMRFADENCEVHMSKGDCYVAEMMAKQEQGHGYVICDSTDPKHAEAIADLQKYNLVIDQANSIEELADMLAKRAVRRSNFLKTVENYNTSAPEDLEIPQTSRENGKATPLVTPPFYAVQATGGCSGTLGGVKIDTDARVLGEGDVPIANLYATACCAGGFSYDEYLGSLATSGVFGKIAAETALGTLA